MRAGRIHGGHSMVFVSGLIRKRRRICRSYPSPFPFGWPSAERPRTSGASSMRAIGGGRDSRSFTNQPLSGQKRQVEPDRMAQGYGFPMPVLVEESPSSEFRAKEDKLLENAW